MCCISGACGSHTIAYMVLVGAGCRLSYKPGFLFDEIREERPSNKAELMQVADQIIIDDEQFTHGSLHRTQGPSDLLPSLKVLRYEWPEGSRAKRAVILEQ